VDADGARSTAHWRRWRAHSRVEHMPVVYWRLALFLCICTLVGPFIATPGAVTFIVKTDSARCGGGGNIGGGARTNRTVLRGAAGAGDPSPGGVSLPSYDDIINGAVKLCAVWRLSSANSYIFSCADAGKPTVSGLVDGLHRAFAACVACENEWRFATCGGGVATSSISAENVALNAQSGNR